MAAVQEFSVEEKLVALIELQKIDYKLDQIFKVRGELPLQVKDIEDSLEGLKIRQKKVEEEINGIQEFITGKTEFIKLTETAIRKYEKQLAAVKNNREFEALDKEIKFQSLELKLAEKHISNANEDTKEKVRVLESIKKNSSEKQFFLGQKQGELDTIVQETEKDHKHYSKLSDNTKKGIDEKLLRAYERIRKSYKNGLGIVAIVRDACGGCFSSIPPQKHSEIKQRKNIMICENCGRILTDQELYDKVKIK